MKLTTIGLNHQTAPLSIREKLAFTAAQLPEALRDLALHAAEAVILSTCNRTELYCVGDADAVIESARIFTPSAAAKPSTMPSAWPAVWTAWFWANRKFWGR